MVRRIGIVSILLVLAACQSQLMLMPTPEVLKDPQFNVFAMNPEPMTTNTLGTLFVTNRVPAGEGNSSFFTGKPDEYLHFGVANAMIGEENLNIFELVDQSTAGERTEKFAWTIREAPILSSTLRPTEIRPGPDVPEDMVEFIAALNEHIAENPIKELTIYVHGASNTFNWSVSQGAQFQYFTGDNAMVMTFAWPSPGSIFGYGRDKRRSDKSATDLAYLIELMAHHSTATRINLVAYSAGGRVVGRALTELGRHYTDRNTLRLGHVYLTQSDQPLAEFVDGLPTFIDLLEGLTVTAAVGDPVLGMARMTDRKLRLGAVGQGDGVDLDITEEERARIIEIVNSDRMVMIDLRDVPANEYKFTHGAWYESSWVSTDVMATLLGGLKAEERGLNAVMTEGVQVWHFPPDYVERLKTILLARRDNQATQPDP